MLAPPETARTSTHPVPLSEAISTLAAELSQTLSRPDYKKWLGQIRKTGGCARPVRLTGHVDTIDKSTGELLHSFDTRHEHGTVYVPCNNRRTTVCPPCSEVYRGDTYQLIRAGLTGGKGVPETVREHSRLFLTLTAPSFGTVHTRHTKNGAVLPCHARRNAGTCEHGRLISCTARHDEDDPVLGHPICPSCYDYTAHVLWHAHTGELWRRFITGTYRALARQALVPERELRKHVRLSYAKVAEYQRRGAVHFHAIARLDGRNPDDPDRIEPLPSDFADLDVPAAITESAGTVALVLDLPAVGEFTLRWGAQVDTRPVTASADDDAAITEEKVAGYIAKYATKSAETTGTINRRIRAGDDIPYLRINNHARTLIATCWRLGGLADLEHLHLRKWAHMLGFRGHFSTKARRYSTTLGALRQVRADYRATANRERLGLPADDTTLVIGHWRVAGFGHDTRAHQLLANLVADTQRQVHAIAEQENHR